MALTDYVDFTNNYLVKNGMIGNATNFNKSIDKLKLEVDELNTTKVQKVTSTDNAIPRFDGTAGDLQNSNVTISDTGVITGSLSGNASTATALQTPRNIGGVAFNGTADITLPGVNATGNQATTGNAATATKLATTRNIALTGDITGNVNFDGTANVSIATTLAANSIVLGTDTTGNYVAGNTAGTGISITGTAGEGWSPTITLTNVGAAGTYRSVTTDAQGRVTAGTNPTTLAGYGITDAQTASRTTATFTTVANTWYRIATSAVGIGRNSAEFVVDWTVSGNHGSIRFAAACHYGEVTGVSLIQTNYSKYGTSGITEARIVYHTTLTGNYAYVEVKFAGALTNVIVNVEMQDPLGWTLVVPSTAGSIPDGYTSYLHTFVPSAAITAGTFPKVTINQEGRVTSGTTLVAADIPVLDTSKITTGTLPVLRGGTGVTTSTGTGNVVLSTSPTLVTPNIGVATGTSFNSITGLSSVVGTTSGTAAVGTSTTVARADHVHPIQTTITGNAGTATKLTNSSGDWSGSGAIANVVGMLSWKNYGNGHAIFDASQGTAPNGTAVNNTNSAQAWNPSYPTLMGWNGANTFGVRVDSARVSDSCTGNAATATTVQGLDLKYMVPSGGIIMWSGSTASIPTGWVLCNGSNNTPNLTNRFVIGAGSSYAVGATGGSADAVVVSHSHTASTDLQGSHAHSAWTDSQGSHTHGYNRAEGYSSGLDAYVGNGAPQYGTAKHYVDATGAHGHNIGMNDAGAHGHNIGISTNGESGTNKNLPPYYALCYIMKT